MKDEHEIGLDDPSVTVFIIKSILFASAWHLTLGCFVILLSSPIIFKRRPKSFYFSHFDGREMKVLPGETRYTRFTHG